MGNFKLKFEKMFSKILIFTLKTQTVSQEVNIISLFTWNNRPVFFFFFFFLPFVCFFKRTSAKYQVYIVCQLLFQVTWCSKNIEAILACNSNNHMDTFSSDKHYTSICSISAKYVHPVLSHTHSHTHTHAHIQVLRFNDNAF